MNPVFLRSCQVVDTRFIFSGGCHEIVRGKETATLLALLLTILISGCLVATQETIITPRSALFRGTYKVDPYMEKTQAAVGGGSSFL